MKFGKQNLPTFHSSLQMDTMKLKSYVVTLLLSLISFPSIGSENPLPTKTISVWEATEDGTDYKIVKVSDERFLIAYGNGNNISGYVFYDRQNGSTGTEYVPWTSVSSDITIGIQETSSQSIGVMLSIDGETTSFVAKPYGPSREVRDVIRAGRWFAAASGMSMQLHIASNLVDASVDLGKCTVTGKIESTGQANAFRVTLSPTTAECPAVLGPALDTTLLFSGDLAVLYTTNRESGNLIFVGSRAGSNVLSTTPQPRHSPFCAQWRAMCRAKCSATTLPTGNFGFRFWNCVNSCNALAGC
ncbi:hypothetical protein KTD13_01435 [Burkholderia multivorans]|uniref:hypothetical protein n=1 Tax=Burkholderia multivorans TaxID=87883 RepID=UPI001C23FBF7|nr:hypothetical protein [Burkholderia multivorans]MBU9259007.1 hypothetical protein [Burkholderia multivorans]